MASPAAPLPQPLLPTRKEDAEERPEEPREAARGETKLEPGRKDGEGVAGPRPADGDLRALRLLQGAPDRRQE